jgi:putative endonuclease
VYAPRWFGGINMKQPAVYILTNKKNGTLYTGVTSHLLQRIYQHKQGSIKSFTEKYYCKLLMWYELHETMESAIMREKLIKAGSRANKINLIKQLNPNWDDLYDSITV